ncbi:uncharacterized protein LOC128886008 isoform X2 [Hylaeus anthracinus]|uniref:uncharacterized protein LOC128886008 isoform X2 n=1 Tax=Hylaeus anthracinus TaxID=313031 RepID=UPI0023B8EC5D|nr:uncharacterized protein LOC128886008 isoform X2 [Hylaeus anthracinus]
MEDEGSPSAVSGENASKAPESITGWMESTVVTASQTTLGQMLFKLVDSFLWVVEKSTQWSLPAQEINAEENGKVFGKIELVRPLPWILFLPGLVILRIVRVALNAGAFVLRYPRIEPSGMVKFLQKSRRRLRALNIKAIKSARRKMGNKDKRLTMIETEKALIRSIRLTLSSLSCLDTSKSSPSPPPTKIRITGMDLEMVATPDEKSTTESAESPMHTEAKRKFSQVSSDEESSDESDNETLLAKLDRLALEDSTDDPDFDPTNCSTESSTSNSENEVGQNTSVTDVTEVQKELTEIVKDNKEKPTIFPLDKSPSCKQSAAQPTILSTEKYLLLCHPCPQYRHLRHHLHHPRKSQTEWSPSTRHSIADLAMLRRRRSSEVSQRKSTRQPLKKRRSVRARSPDEKTLNRERVLDERNDLS